MLDEFQDTDPLQIQLALRIAGVADEADVEVDWDRSSRAPERLFVVGDPKQSIYRFRRATSSCTGRSSTRSPRTCSS